MDAAEKIYEAFRQVTKSPIKAIVYTHNHQDHVNGAEAFLKDVDGNSSVHIWSHRSLIDIFRLTNYVTGPIIYKRAMRQFGALIERENTPNSGIGFSLNLGQKQFRSGFVPPNRFLDGAEADVTIAGLKLKLVHIPGETDDQIAVYWPEKEALFCADDVYKAFPNLYAIRGTPFAAWNCGRSRWIECTRSMPSTWFPVIPDPLWERRRSRNCC
ncbi:hypothetical protein BOX15_Mlig009765g2 [Macrostomum lignano]|uniref:Metallo-beta-lactamase domain-containing protein n=1 Tax=Macrostomum lignano TaxID=282301 RepID=A0A267DR11_9PLAT|nr:hypothetical protein BOX15_Mlig009765g2 [Macrostomum lignano]